jgi:hypothetical protein
MSQDTDRPTTIPSRRAFLTRAAPAAAAFALAGGATVNVLAIVEAKADGPDWPAIVARAEGVIDRLRNYYGAAKWKVQNGAAAGFLKYWRDRAAGLPDDETEWGAVIDFIDLHGQSFDWIISGDPVSMISVMASHSRWASRDADPIFAIIERHRAAFNEHARAARVFHKFAAVDGSECSIVIGEYAEKKCEYTRGLGPLAEHHAHLTPTGKMVPIVAFSKVDIARNAPVDMTDPERSAWIKMMERRLRAAKRRYKNSPRSLAYDVWNDAGRVLRRLTEEMIDTPPTTIGGVAAVLTYWSEIATEDQHFLDLYATAGFLEKMGQAAAAIA